MANQAMDVVSNTRLTEEDTEETVAAWQAVRDNIINPSRRLKNYFWAKTTQQRFKNWPCPCNDESPSGTQRFFNYASALSEEVFQQPASGKLKTV